TNTQSVVTAALMPAMGARVELVPDRKETVVVSPQQHSMPPVADLSSSPRMAIRKRTLAAAAILAIIGTGLYFYRDRLNDFGNNLYNSNLQSSNEVEPVLNLASTSKTYVHFLTLQELTATRLPRKFAGTVRPHRISEIGFNRIGIVEEIHAERGARVERGTVLAKLSTDSLEASMVTLQAKRDAASARLKELIAGPRQQTIQSAINQVNAAMADLELAKSTAQRTSRLVQIGGASKQDLENADTNLKAKEQMLQVARNTLSELQEGTRSEQIAAQKAMLSEILAAESELKVQLNESTIVAPFSGVVSDRFLEKGAISSPGVPILRLVEANMPEAWVGVSPEYIEQLQDVTDPELVVQGEGYKGRIKSILPELDKASRTKTVVFELDTSNGPELFGQTVSIEVFREVQDRGFWLPQTALVKGDHGLWGAFALEQTSDSEEEQKFVIKKQELEVLQVDSDRVYVRGTLKAGDKIVSIGVQRLTPGQSVYLAEPSTKEEDTLGLNTHMTAPVLTQNK
ncbi:MAG: efflux RND transporter periplasmic adaptor subunit, partial [Pirellula sp.]|nr:efflux RND transporter periplasmic adaptor subunit [Pirellula sp.]